MRRALKWLIGIGAVVVVLTDRRGDRASRVSSTRLRVQAMIASGAAQADRTAGEVRVAVRLDSSRCRPIELHKLEVAEDPQFGTAPFLTLETGRVYLKLRPLLTGRVEFGDVTLERPRIALIQNADGRLNVASLAPPSESQAPRRSPGRRAAAPPAARPRRSSSSPVKISEGIITYVALGKGPRRDARIASRDLDVSVIGQASQLAFKGALRREAGRSARQARRRSRRAERRQDARSRRPSRAKIGIEGKDIEQLVAAAAGPRPTIAGPIKGDFTLGGTLGVPRDLRQRRAREPAR